MKDYLKKQFINFRGQKTTRKFFVIESDDWGSIRIPNKVTQDYLVKERLITPTDSFSAYDCLERADDYEFLFEVLSGHSDHLGNTPVITANMVMTNPDFAKIKASQFQKFYGEPFEVTYERYYPAQATFDALKVGIAQKFLYPQFHAREHLNASEWLRRLRNKDERFLKAFEVNCFAIDDYATTNSRSNLMASYDYQNDEELLFVQNSINEGLQMFEQTFGFASKTSIAPCYVWNDEIERILHKNEVKGLQSSYIQQKNRYGEHERVWQKMGRTNELNQRYFIRNVLFEPATNHKINWVDKALESISIAFFWGKPAIIGSHRINFVAGLSEENRRRSLAQLDDLLKKVIKKWPDVQFANSEQLLEAYS